MHKKTLLSIKIIIAIILITVLIRRLSLDEIYSALLKADILYIVLAFSLLPLNVFFQFCRWRILVHLTLPSVNNKDILSSLLCGITLGFMTPGRLGEFGRAFLIPQTKWPRLVGLTLIDKLFALMVLFALGLLGMIPFLSRTIYPIVWIPLFFSALAFLILFLILLLYPQLFTTIMLRKKPKLAQHYKWRQILFSLELLNTSISLRLACYAFAQVMTYSIQFYLLIISIHSISFFKCLAAITAIMWVKTMLPFSLGDLGIRESASIFFLGQFGVPSAAAFDASMLLFVMNVLFPALIGFALLLKNQSLQQIKL